MADILDYLDDNDLTKQLRYKKGKYFGTQLYNTTACLRDAITLSGIYGCDREVVCGIILGIDYSKPVYGEYGEKFMKEIDPDYSRVQFAKYIVKKLLSGVETVKEEIICSGIEHFFDGTVTTTEEQVVEIVKYCYEHADRMPSTGMRNICAIDFMKKTIEKSEELGRVVTLKFPEITDLELMEPVVFDKERAERYIKRFYDYYKEHFDEIPEKFKRTFDGESREKTTAIYLITRGESFIAARAYDIWKKEEQKLDVEGKGL